jgi:phage-related protein
MGFFDWIGNTVGNIWGGIKNVAGTIYNGVKKGVDWVADKVKPVVDVVGKVASYIPVVGAPLSGLANQISNGIDWARRGVGTVETIGNQIGAAGDKLFSRGRG